MQTPQTKPLKQEQKDEIRSEKSTPRISSQLSSTISSSPVAEKLESRQTLIPTSNGALTKSKPSGGVDNEDRKRRKPDPSDSKDLEISETREKPTESSQNEDRSHEKPKDRDPRERSSERILERGGDRSKARHSDSPLSDDRFIQGLPPPPPLPFSFVPHSFGGSRREEDIDRKSTATRHSQRLSPKHNEEKERKHLEETLLVPYDDSKRRRDGDLRDKKRDEREALQSKVDLSFKLLFQKEEIKHVSLHQLSSILDYRSYITYTIKHGLFLNNVIFRRKREKERRGVSRRRKLKEMQGLKGGSLKGIISLHWKPGSSLRRAPCSHRLTWQVSHNGLK